MHRKEGIQGTLGCKEARFMVKNPTFITSYEVYLEFVQFLNSWSSITSSTNLAALLIDLVLKTELSPEPSGQPLISCWYKEEEVTCSRPEAFVSNTYISHVRPKDN